MHSSSSRLAAAGNPSHLLPRRVRWIALLLNRFWSAPPEAQFMMANAFFEHLGLVGGFLLVAWDDLRTRRQP